MKASKLSRSACDWSVDPRRIPTTNSVGVAMQFDARSIAHRCASTLRSRNNRGTMAAMGMPKPSARRRGRPSPDALSARDARRIALAAQGFGSRPARPTLRHVRGVFDAVSLIQIDSVNVVCRSQELPLWARLGAHGRDALPELCERRAIFEYWAHVASLMPVELQPLLRWRMAEAATRAWRLVRAIARRDPGYVAAVRAEVRARGAVAARQLEDRAPARKRTQGWWSWDDRKRALEYLFWAGEITATRSWATFERVYAPLDRVLPAEVLAAPTPDPDDARRELLAHSARALGVATLRDLADYFRISVPLARPRVAELVEAGRLVPVAVEGWG